MKPKPAKKGADAKRPPGHSLALYRKRRRDRGSQQPRAAEARNGYLDSLRGLAIALMMVDHTAGLIFQTPIDYSTIRFGTRLSMPLFALLMGYFFQQRVSDQAKQLNWQALLKRLFQILLAAIATNLLYYSAYGVFDILADLGICYTLFLLTGNKIVFGYLALLFYPYDPTKGALDYPLTIVLSLVAQGAILRRMGMGGAIVSAIVMTVVGVTLVEKPPLLVLLFSLPATLLVGWAAMSKGISHPWLALLGRYPLSVYVAQYYILFGIAKCIDKTMH